MSWNDPDNKDRDPWGNRRNEQGPPDLDEVGRKMQEKLGGFFGGKNNGSTSGGGTSGAAGLALIGILVAALVPCHTLGGLLAVCF